MKGKNSEAIKIALEKLESDTKDFILHLKDGKPTEEYEDKMIDKYWMEAWPMIMVSIVNAINNKMELAKAWK